MNNNLEELTQKIYTEGVEKANTKGEALIEAAKVKAQEIITNAETKATEIIKSAEKQAAESKIQHQAEMKLSSRQAIITLKQKITDLIIWDVVADPIKGAFQDEEFVQNLIGKLIDYWTAHFGKEEKLDILLPEDHYKEVQKNMRSKTQELLQKGINIEFNGTMKDGFQISPEDGRFTVRFTSEDFENYFKTFARPRTYQLLYGDQS